MHFGKAGLVIALPFELPEVAESGVLFAGEGSRGQREMHSFHSSSHITISSGVGYALCCMAVLSFLAGHGDALAFVGGFLAVAGALLDFFWEHSHEPQKYRSKRRKLACLVAIGGILSIGGALVASRQSEQAQRRLVATQNTLLTKSDELATFVTGGDSYCYVASGFENVENPTDLPFYFFQNGSNPVWDVKMIITDAYQYQSKLPRLPPDSFVPTKMLTPFQTQKLREAEKTKLHVYVGSLTPGESGTAFTKPPKPAKQRYEIQILTRNGYFVETLLAEKVNGRWVSAYRVWRSTLRMSNPQEPPKRQVAEYINPNFPKSEITWK